MLNVATAVCNLLPETDAVLSRHPARDCLELDAKGVKVLMLTKLEIKHILDNLLHSLTSDKLRLNCCQSLETHAIFLLLILEVYIHSLLLINLGKKQYRDYEHSTSSKFTPVESSYVTAY